MSSNLHDILPVLCVFAMKNGETASDGIWGVFVRDLAVGAVVGFELAGDELELPVEDVALRAAALCAECVEFAAQAVQFCLKVCGFHIGQVLEYPGGVFRRPVKLCVEFGAAPFVHFAAVCAECGNIAGQGVAGFEEGEAGLQAAGEFFGFAAHIG